MPEDERDEINTIFDLGDCNTPAEEDYLHLWDTSESIDTKVTLESIKQLFLGNEPANILEEIEKLTEKINYLAEQLNIQLPDR